MQLSHYATYGILVLQELRKAQGPLTKFQLGAALGIGPIYVQQLMIRLIEAGLAASVRGPHGGYRLADREHKATVREVVEAMRMAAESRGPGRFSLVYQRVQAHLLKALDKLKVDAL
jgi:Rrf2 family protein